MNKAILSLIVALTGIQGSWAQTIKDMGLFTASIARQTANGEGSGFYDKGTSGLIDVWWFTYDYPSVSADGQPVMLSAMACMPNDRTGASVINNVVVGCHATITDNAQCPTEFNRTGSITSDVFMMMYHAGVGFGAKPDEADPCYYNLVILPDYEGYGITADRTHPYLCEGATAQQVVDAVRYGIELYQDDEQVKRVRRPFRDNWHTIIEGYSQGGAVAMATQRHIEQNGLAEELHLAGSICGDGPYDPLATMLYYVEQDAQGHELSMPVVVPLMLQGLLAVTPAGGGASNTPPYTIDDFLNPRFLATGILDWLAEKAMTTDDITKALRNLYAEGKDGDREYYRSVLTSSGRAYLKDIMNASVYEYFKSLLQCHPDYTTHPIAKPEGGSAGEWLHMALEENVLTNGWTPDHPVCLFHSTADDVVPYLNSQRARASFGDEAKWFESALNGSHVGTGVEFFTGSVRDDCFRLLTESHVGIEGLVGQTERSLHCYDAAGCPAGTARRHGVCIHHGWKHLFAN